MPPPYYYRLVRAGGQRYKRCGGCRRDNFPSVRRCVFCGVALRPRPRRRRDRSLDARLAKAQAALDAWLTALARAVGRVQHYRRRVATLQRARAHTGSRPLRPPSRAIRLRA